MREYAMVIVASVMMAIGFGLLVSGQVGSLFSGIHVAMTVQPR